MKKSCENKQLSEYWQDRRKFLDYPIQTHGYWKCINEEARKRNIKTMRELLKKVSYHELRSDETLCDSQAKAFIYFLIYFRCFKMLDLSYPPFKKSYKYIWLGKTRYVIKTWVLGKNLEFFGRKC
jgi:hypothetical protein